MTTAVDLSHTLYLAPRWLLREDILSDIQTLSTSIRSTRTPGGRVSPSSLIKIYETIRHLNLTANRLPKPISEAAVVPYKDSFFLVGGGNRDDGLFFKDIYQYDVDNDAWIEVEGKLKTARSDPIALPVQKSLFPECP